MKQHLGARPVEWVLNNMEIDDSCCFIHCTQMQPHEIQGLAKSGAIAGLCPITEASLGDGIFEGVRWLDSGGAIAIGSDSNIRISLSEEIRTLENIRSAFVIVREPRWLAITNQPDAGF